MGGADGLSQQQQPNDANNEENEGKKRPFSLPLLPQPL